MTINSFIARTGKPWLDLAEEIEQGILQERSFLTIFDNIELAQSPWNFVAKVIDLTIRLSKFGNDIKDGKSMFFTIIALNGYGLTLRDMIDRKAKIIKL